ncbi:MAG: hypothetical protein JST91_19940 [Actinobacteria bacterium]|nr:hypothetical protein [Actinomycetota bacterium]
MAKSFIARQRRLRFAPSDPAVAAAEGYRSWCETAWVAFVHREPDTNVDLGAVAQQWRLMAYASDLRDPTRRFQKREWLTLVLMSIGVAAIFLTPSGGVAAAVVCAAAAVVVAYRRNRGGTEVLVVGPDASPRAQRRALWHWDYSDFL